MQIFFNPVTLLQKFYHTKHFNKITAVAALSITAAGAYCLYQRLYVPRLSHPDEPDSEPDPPPPPPLVERELPQIPPLPAFDELSVTDSYSIEYSFPNEGVSIPPYYILGDLNVPGHFIALNSPIEGASTDGNDVEGHRADLARIDTYFGQLDRLPTPTVIRLGWPDIYVEHHLTDQISDHCEAAHGFRDWGPTYEQLKQVAQWAEEALQAGKPVVVQSATHGPEATAMVIAAYFVKYQIDRGQELDLVGIINKLHERHQLLITTEAQLQQLHDFAVQYREEARWQPAPPRVYQPRTLERPLTTDRWGTLEREALQRYWDSVTYVDLSDTAAWKGPTLRVRSESVVSGYAARIPCHEVVPGQPYAWEFLLLPMPRLAALGFENGFMRTLGDRDNNVGLLVRLIDDDALDNHGQPATYWTTSQWQRFQEDNSIQEFIDTSWRCEELDNGGFWDVIDDDQFYQQVDQFAQQAQAVFAAGQRVALTSVDGARRAGALIAAYCIKQQIDDGQLADPFDVSLKLRRYFNGLIAPNELEMLYRYASEYSRRNRLT